VRVNAIKTHVAPAELEAVRGKLGESRSAPTDQPVLKKITILLAPGLNALSSMSSCASVAAVSLFTGHKMPSLN
jgi:hypothetical protein